MSFETYIINGSFQTYIINAVILYYNLIIFTLPLYILFALINSQINDVTYMTRASARARCLVELYLQ
jgi:hypothetical protein